MNIQLLFRFLYIYLLLQFEQILVVHSSLLKNGVVGDPRVDCGVDLIKVYIQTENEFNGRLYVEEELAHADCLHNYNLDKSHIRGTDSRIAEFGIHLGQCNMRRQRMLNPRGVSYSFTLVISFHPIFLTGVDKAFHIKCFFLEAVKAVDIALDVSPLTTVVVEREFALPQCNYYLKQDVNGPYLKFANIGEPITHVWQCTPLAGWIYGILIHSCYVDDGRGNRFELVDEKGCAIDRYLLDDIVYNEQSLSAFVNSHVFRYADRVQLFFTCTLQLCFKDDGGCSGITPPICTRSNSTPGPRSKGTPTENRINIPALVAPRELLRKMSSHGFRQNSSFLRRTELAKTTEAPGPQELILLGNSYRDLPINNDTDISDIITTNNNGTIRTSRQITIGNMETDLSADLTVLPLHDQLTNKDSDLLTQKRKKNYTAVKESTIVNIPLTNMSTSTEQKNIPNLEEQISSIENAHLNSINPQCLRKQNYIILITIFIITIIFTTIFTSLICLTLQKWKFLSICCRLKCWKRSSSHNSYFY